MHWAFEGLRAGYDLRDDMPSWLHAVDNDSNDAKALLCGRRSGKSSYLAIKLCADGLPGEVHPFVAMTQQKARDILWPVLERLSKKTGMQVSYDRSRGLAITDRGVRIQAMGLSTKQEIEKLRGERYPGVVFDECGAINGKLLKSAIIEAAEPATLDFAGRGGFGVICAGTPSYAPNGTWYDICGGNDGPPGLGFTVHRATVLENHHVPNAKLFLDRKLKARGWTEDNAEYQREWLGRFCLSSDGLCYGSAWSGVVEDRAFAPTAGLTLISLDFGESSPCAWSVVRATLHSEEIEGMIHESIVCHALEAQRKVCGSLNEIAGITRALMKKHGASYLVGDSAEGFGIRQLVQQYGLPFEKSLKSGKKQERIFMMQGMLRCGTLRIYQDCPDLIEEIQTVPWNEDHDDHHQSYSDHCCDSLHYAVEKVLQLHKTKPATPAPGTEEHRRQQEAALKQRLIDAARKLRR